MVESLEQEGKLGKGQLRREFSVWSPVSLSNQGASSQDPLLSPERLRSPSLLEYANKDKPMKEPEWSKDYTKWVSSPHFNRLGKWLAKVDLGKPPSDEEQARERFGLDWSSQEERVEIDAQEDFNESEIEGLIRTHTCRPPHRQSPVMVGPFQY